jgi:hypothetical protein
LLLALTRVAQAQEEAPSPNLGGWIVEQVATNEFPGFGKMFFDDAYCVAEKGAVLRGVDLILSGIVFPHCNPRAA